MKKEGYREYLRAVLGQDLLNGILRLARGCLGRNGKHRDYSSKHVRGGWPGVMLRGFSTGFI